MFLPIYLLQMTLRFEIKKFREKSQTEKNIRSKILLILYLMKNKENDF